MIKRIDIIVANVEGMFYSALKPSPKLTRMIEGL
jgi:hypothetical protein